MIDEYQDEFVALSASLEDEEIPIVGIQKRPQDQDNFAGNPDPVQESNMNLSGEQPGQDPGDQTTATLDLEIPEPTISITGTIGITGTKNMTPTKAAESYDPGPCETSGSCTPPDDVHSTGPYTYSYSDDETAPPHNPGIHGGYGPGYTGVTPQQPPTTNPMIGNDNSNQPTENKGNKP